MTENEKRLLGILKEENDKLKENLKKISKTIKVEDNKIIIHCDLQVKGNITFEVKESE